MSPQIVGPQQVSIHNGALGIGGIQALLTLRIIRQLGENRLDDSIKLPAGFKPEKFYWSPSDLAQAMLFLKTGHIFDETSKSLIEVGRRHDDDPTGIETGAPLLGANDCFIIDQSTRRDPISGKTVPVRDMDQLVDQWKNNQISGVMLGWQFKRKFQTFRNVSGFVRDANERVKTLRFRDGSEYHLRPGEVIRFSQQKKADRKLTDAIRQFEHVILDVPQVQLSSYLDPWLLASGALITYDFRSLQTGEIPSLECWRFMGRRPDVRIGFLLKNRMSFELSIASVASHESSVESFTLHALDALPAGVAEYFKCLGTALVDDLNERQRKTVQVSAVSAKARALLELDGRRKELYDRWFKTTNRKVEAVIMNEIKALEEEILEHELDLNMSSNMS